MSWDCYPEAVDERTPAEKAEWEADEEQARFADLGMYEEN